MLPGPKARSTNGYCSNSSSFIDSDQQPPTTITLDGSRCLARPGVHQVRDEALVRLLADRAGVEDEEVGVVGVRRLAQPEGLQQALDALRVVHVHLAAEGRSPSRCAWPLMVAVMSGRGPARDRRGRHHPPGRRRDRERCQHDASRWRRRRRRHPPGGRPGDPRGVARARRLPDRRRQGDGCRPAAGALRRPRGRPGVAGRRRW